VDGGLEMNSRLRKLTECFFLVLILSAFLIPFSNVLGESTFSPQIKAETLLSIVEKANETVVAIHRDLKTRGLQIPQEALVLYTEGLAKADESFSLRDSGNYEEASGAAVEALKKFKESLDVVYDEIEEPSVLIESVVEVMMRLNNSITRGFRYLSYIENLSSILEAEGYDTAVIENKIQSARGLLYKALGELRLHRFKSASETLLLVKDFLDKVMQRFAMVSLDLKVSRLETYMADADERIGLLKAKVLSLSSELSPEAQNASLAALQNAESSLDNARSYLEVQMVNEVVNELVDSKESEEEAVRIISENQTSVGSVSGLGTNISYLEQVS
jgi:hypothetical protein